MLDIHSGREFLELFQGYLNDQPVSEIAQNTKLCLWMFLV